MIRSAHDASFRRSRRNFLLAASLTVFASALSCSTAAQPTESRRPIATIAELIGSAEIHRSGQVLFAKAGDPIEETDRVLTASGSRLDLAFADGTHLVLGDNTDIAIAVYAPRPDGNGQALIGLASGILRAVTRLSNRFSRFEIRTATAIASVRSTDWLVIHDNTKDASAVFVRDGRVAVSGIQQPGEVVLSRGYGTDIAANAAPTRPARWGAPRIDAAERRVGLR